MKDNKELRKLIESNPDLPLVFLVNSEYVDGGYYYTLFQYSKCYISEIYFDDEH